MTDTKRYTIRDPRPTRKESPWSFYMPCEARQDAVATGDMVQIIFEAPDPQDGAERMWLYVTETRGSKLLGTCLLYTSPSPRDATLSRMPSSA